MIIILTTETPMWTDIWQTIAALIGIPATIVGFIILFIKDRNKENQIQKLSDIAENLNRMVADSEKRYINTRKPILDIEVVHLDRRKEIKLKFSNFNQTSHVESYTVLDLNDKYYDIIVDNLTRKKQDFGIILHYTESPNEFPVIQMRYVMTEGYSFYQFLRLHRKRQGLGEGLEIEVLQDPIFNENEN